VAPTRLPEPYRELTRSAMVFAIAIGLVMNAAITYAGLKIGFTTVGSAIAAVLGFGVLRGLLRRGTILEVNITQTVASTVNTSNAGVIFTVPVLFLLGYELTVRSVDFWMIAIACTAGAVMGVAFIIPLRKQMIDIERLRFPTGTAVASILKSPGAGAAKSIVLLGGIAVGALIFLPTQLSVFGLSTLADLPLFGANQGGFITADAVDAGRVLGLPPQFQLVFAIAPFALGAGYLTGRPGLFVLAGGILAFFVLTPVAFAMGWMPETITGAQAPAYGFGAFNRPLGIGMLLGGALMGVIFSLPATREALKAMAFTPTGGGRGDELGLKTISGIVVGGFIFLFVAALLVVGKPVNATDPIDRQPIAQPAATAEYAGYTLAFGSAATADAWAALATQQRDAYLRDELSVRPGWLSGVNRYVRAFIVALVGSLWIWFAGIIIAQSTGMTDWSPVSGLALLTVVLVLLLAGTGAVLAAVLIGAALCVAITLAADTMADLKTGYLVGALPRKQQVAQLASVWLGPIVALLTILLIVAANIKQFGVPLGPGTPTSAPQAQALQAVITGVQGGDMPYALYGMGTAIGMALGIGIFPGLGVLIGLSMYLPFVYLATYGIGCLVNMAVNRMKGAEWAEAWGVPFAAGLIVGESMLALAINSYVLVSG
jgi:uncharacterized oligopeptide transporter (OPT) family protein